MDSYQSMWPKDTAEASTPTSAVNNFRHNPKAILGQHKALVPVWECHRSVIRDSHTTLPGEMQQPPCANVGPEDRVSGTG